MTLEDAQAQAMIGVRYGTLYPQLENDQARRMFQAWWPWATAYIKPAQPVSNVLSQEQRGVDKPPPVLSGNACKTCGGGLVRGGKCEYCPYGCGSEGECS